MSTSVPTGNTYDKYRSKNPIERRLMQGFFAALSAALPSEHPTTVLEVGVGEGEISAKLRSLYPRAHIVGIDLHDDALAAGWRARGFVGVYADITALPFPPLAFDLVMAIEVLEHVHEPHAALAELVRVSRGRLVLSVPREPIWRVANMARGKYLADFGNTPGHVQHWSRRGFAELVGSQLEVMSVSTPFPWTMIEARPQGVRHNGSGRHTRGARGLDHAGPTGVGPGREMATTVAPPGDAAPAASPPQAGGAAPASAPPWRTRFVLMVVAALLVGFALRVAIGLTDDAPATDETAYLRSGVSLVEGDGYQREGNPELHFPPFVPVLLGLASQVTSDPHTGTVVLTCLSSTALIIPLALIGRRIAGPGAGVATAWVAALGPGLSTTLVNRGAGSEAEYTLLVVGALWLVISAVDHQDRARAWRVFGSGVLVGLAYLTRPEGLFIAVPLALAVLVLAVRRPGQPARLRRLDVRGLRSGAPLLAVFLLPIAVCIVPYAMYLHDNTGKWQLSAKTQDASIEAWHAVARADREERDSVLYALDETGLEFAAGRSSLTTLAREHPAGYLGIVRTNVGALATSVASPVTNQWLAWLLLPLPLWGLAAVGAWRHRRSGVVRLLLAVGALPVATALAFFVQPRYLIVAAALATPLVGAAIGAMSAAWRRPVMLLVVALLALSSVQAFHSEGAGWWHPSDHSDQREAGEWIAAATRPGDRVMTRSMVVDYYAERPTMAIPYASLDEILRYARHYGARYLVVDWYTAVRLRPQLAPLRSTDRIPGLRLAHEVRAEGRTTRIFALDPPPPSLGPIGSSLGFVGDGQS